MSKQYSMIKQLNLLALVPAQSLKDSTQEL